MTVKLSQNKGNGGHVTAYRLIIGSKEARDCGLVNEDGTGKEVVKILDPEHHRIIIELAEEKNKV